MSMRIKVANGIVLALLGLLMSPFSLAATQSVIVVGVGVYWDENCTQPVSSVYWGSVAPGTDKKVTVFVRNEGSGVVALSLGSSNWNPQRAADFMSLAWDYAGETVEPSGTVSVTLDLYVSKFVVGVGDFVFDIVISVTRELTSFYMIFSAGTVLYLRIMEATVDLHPQALNLGSKGKWITAYIELPEGYDVENIDVSLIMLNESIAAESRPAAIGDFDNDALPDLMVKFDRAQVISHILDYVSLEELVKGRCMSVTLAMTGRLVDGTPFEGTNAVGIICNVLQKL